MTTKATSSCADTRTCLPMSVCCIILYVCHWVGVRPLTKYTSKYIAQACACLVIKLTRILLSSSDGNIAIYAIENARARAQHDMNVVCAHAAAAAAAAACAYAPSNRWVCRCGDAAVCKWLNIVAVLYCIS